MVRTGLRRLLLLSGVLLSLRAQCRGAEFYVSPSGTPAGDGSLENPWSLAVALAAPPAVRPGDTIWLRGGTYRGTFESRLNGSAESPIVVRQFPGERATLDGGNSGFVSILSVSGSYTWYQGFEITSTDPVRVSAQTGSSPTDIGRGGGVATVQDPGTGAGLKFINLVVHDTAGGFGLWREATDLEVSGCLVYNNGWLAPDRGHGHGFYVQNLTGTKRITDNLIFANFSHGIQAYGSEAADLDNITIQGNTIFDNGLAPEYERNVLVGGGSVARNPQIVQNILFYPGATGQNLNVGYDPYGAGSVGAVITGNYVVNGVNLFSALNTAVTMTGNSFFSPTDASIQTRFPTNVYSMSPPAAPAVFIRRNAYEAGRANITVVNWGGAAAVPVDIGTILPIGAAYEIVDAQDFFGPPVARGVHDGSPIILPMAGLSTAPPLGLAPFPATGLRFNVFVLLPEIARRTRPEPSLQRRPSPRHLLD